MRRKQVISPKRVALLLAVGLAAVNVIYAQVSSVPSANCHVTDGTFTACSNGQIEWADVQPLFFSASNSYLYVNQDSARSFLYLMYDFPVRTDPLGPTDSIHVTFDTVSNDFGPPALEQYEVLIFGSGEFQVLEQGQPTPAGRILAAAGFGPSPNSSTPHLIAELQVPLTPGLPTVYDPDSLFWSAVIPSTPPPPPLPPTCPDGPAACVKSPQQIDLLIQQADADDAWAELTLALGPAVCDAASQSRLATAKSICSWQKRRC